MIILKSCNSVFVQIKSSMWEMEENARGKLKRNILRKHEKPKYQQE